MNQLLYLLFFIGIQQLYSISLNIEGKSPQCFYKDVTKTQKLCISYVVSGDGEDRLTFSIFQESRFTSEGNQKKWALMPKFNITGKRDFEYKIIVEEDQEFRICFKSEDGKSKTISFDFIIDDRVEAENKDKRALTLQSLKKNHRKLEKIFSNQRYQYTRDHIHSNKISSMTNKIKWCSLIKMFILILVCGLQVYLLTSFFKNKSTNVAPQTMME